MVGEHVVPPALAAPNSVQAISGGFRFLLALRTDGSVAAFGSNTFEQVSPLPDAVTSPGRVTAVAAGKYHALALLTNGTVLQWGRRPNAGTPPPEALAGGIVSIHANDDTSSAVRFDGKVFGWGSAYTGKPDAPADSTAPTTFNSPCNVSSIARTLKNGWMLLCHNGTLVNYTTAEGAQPLEVPSIQTGIAHVEASMRNPPIHFAALLRNGSVRAWGRDELGQSSRPSLEIQNAVAVAAGLNTVRLRGGGWHLTVCMHWYDTMLGLLQQLVLVDVAV